ncbi:MAG: carboxypeptidase-like regulatory domain-containing protein [Candidatus Altiarchaeota archaeon]
MKLALSMIMGLMLASTCSADVLIDQNIRLGDDGSFYDIEYSKTFTVEEVPEGPVLVFSGVSGVERMSDWSWYSYDDVILNGKKITLMNYIAGNNRIQVDKSLIRKGSNTLVIKSGMTNYQPEGDARDDFSIGSITLIDSVTSNLELTYSDKKLKAKVTNSKTGDPIPSKEVNFHEEAEASAGPTPLGYIGKSNTDATGVAEIRYDPADKSKPKTIVATEAGGASDRITIEFGEDKLQGMITDGHGNPMPYVKITVNFDGVDYPGRSNADGSYEVKVKDFTPDNDNPKEVKLKIEFTYERDGKNYYKVIDETKGANKPVMFEKKFKLKAEADKTQNIDFNLAPSPDITSSSNIGNLKHLAPVYFHSHEAIDFMLTVLKANVEYKLPVDVWVAGNDGTYYSPTHGLVSIDKKDAHYGSSNRPDNREYHELCHHLMYATYNSWPPYPAGTTNHGGYINPSTGDSYVEGFAEFMAMVISEHYGEASPEIYAGFGSFDRNYKPWEWTGKAEEIAVAGILWDLYDKGDNDDDAVSLSLGEMWSILKVKRNDFYEYYKAFRSAHPDKAGKIDDIFIRHGFFADKGVGNRRRDSFEPYRDANNNKAYDAGEHYVDYGQPPEGILRHVFNYWMVYDRGEIVGKATNYERENRSMAVMIDNAFIRVKDTEVEKYRVFVHFNNPAEGGDYDYTTDVRDGLIYVMPLPEEDNATIMVKPDSEDYIASDVYEITTREYAERYYATPEGRGYFDEHTFDLKPTGKHEDEKYDTFDSNRPAHVIDSGYRGKPGDTGGGNNGGNGDDRKPVCCCLGPLAALAASLAAAVVGVKAL